MTKRNRFESLFQGGENWLAAEGGEGQAKADVT
jgi:hypothetical protein